MGVPILTPPGATSVQSPCHPNIRSLNAGRCPLCEPLHPFENETSMEGAADPQAELDRLEEAARVELARLDMEAARLDLGEFVRQAWHVLESVELEWSWHHDALCKNIQGMLEEWLRIRTAGGARRAWLERRWRNRWQKLIVNICPGTLKSRILMVFSVAWMWLKCAEWSVLCVSANPENVRRDAEACRDLIASIWFVTTFQPEFYVRDDIDSKGKFQLSLRSNPALGGFRMSKGMGKGSKFTGFHVDACFMDDPDDAHDVHGEAERRTRKGKVESITSRFNDKRNMTWIVIQQRVHIDDCTGELLSRGGWLHAAYPLHYRAALRTDTPFFTDPRTTEGENMHPDRFTDEVIAAARLELGSQGFDAQYECDPAPDGGATIKLAWFRYFTIAGWKVGQARRPTGTWTEPAYELGLRKDGKLDIDFLDITVDASFGSTSDTASDVSIQVGGGKGPKRFVFHDTTKVRTFLDTVKDIAEQITRWSPHFAGVISVLVEKKANGAAVIEMLAREFQGLIAIEPEGGKESRAVAISPAIESGCVYLLEGAEWLDVYLTGTASIPVFPNGKKDDRMDALSQWMNHRRADIDAMRLAAKNAALISMRAKLAHRAGHGASSS